MEIHVMEIENTCYYLNSINFCLISALWKPVALTKFNPNSAMRKTFNPI